MKNLLTAISFAGILVFNSCSESEKEISAKISVENYSNKNCNRAEDIKKNPTKYPEFSFFDTLCASIEINLVQIETPSKDISEKINQTIVSKICDNYGFGDETYTTIEEVLNSVYDSEDGFEVSIHTEVITNKNNILCIQTAFETYAFGAAHPFGFYSYYNFSLTTGKLITLDELLIPNYQKELTDIGKRNFIRENGEEGWNFSEGDEFVLSDDFAITEKGLLFSYDPYEIGPYAMGAPSVLITYKEISSLIKKDGLLKKL